MNIERLKRWFLAPFIGLIFAISILLSISTSPANAEPAPPTTTTNPADSNSTPADNTGDTTDNTNDADNNGNNDANNTNNNANNTDSTSDDTGDTSCTEQVGPLAWIVCPGTGLLSKGIDDLYQSIESLLAVEPISDDVDSPIFIIWNYVRNISNVVFVIFILVIIYSQVTGLGISNYGIKRTLPRVIIAAILVNLSFLICSIVVDLSNIIGSSLIGFLNSVGEDAMANSTFNPGANISWAEIFSAATVGALPLGVAAFLGGGFTSLLLLLIPVVIGGFLSVVVGLFTISLRQSVVALLIMISPLAFIVYLLPNTEKYFRKWYQIFFQMIVFYPMYSLLFGASRLAGWAILSSAESGLGVILGAAVQVLPLFLGVSLMKMSGSVLSGVSGFLAGLGIRATNASRDVSGSWRAYRRAKYLGETPHKFNIPRRAAQEFQDRRTRRAHYTEELEKTARQRGIAFANRSYRTKDGQGGISRFGRMHAENISRNLEYEGTITAIDNDFNEGISQFEKKGTRNYQRAAAIDQNTMRASDRLKFQQARSRDIEVQNASGYAKRVLEADEQFTKNHQTNQTYRDMQAAVRNRGREGINTIVAKAIATRRSADSETVKDYIALFSETPRTKDVETYLRQALASSNANVSEAAMRVMFQRGDHKDVLNIVEDLDGNFNDINDGKQLIMQKRLTDTFIEYKADNPVAWAYAKANNIARARGDGKFYTMKEFIDSNGAAHADGLDLNTILSEAGDTILANQDRTVSKWAKEHGITLGNPKQDLVQSVSGISGEKLYAANDMVLGNGAIVGEDRKTITFQGGQIKSTGATYTTQEAIKKAQGNITQILDNVNTKMLLGLKTDSLLTFLSTLTLDADSYDGNPIELGWDKAKDGLEQYMKKHPNKKASIARDLANLNRRGALDGVAQSAREMFNQVFDFAPYQEGGTHAGEPPKKKKGKGKGKGKKKKEEGTENPSGTDTPEENPGDGDSDGGES